jgi:hypothetical protein
MNTCLSVLFALFPKRYRRLLNACEIAPSAAILSGILECFVCFGILVYRYFSFMNLRLNGVTQQAALGTAEKAGDTGVMAFGMFFLLEYLIQFTTAALLLLTIEGFLRAATALINRETYPSLPLVLIAFLHGKLEVAGAEILLGRRVPDEVLRESNGDSLQIASCRPKPWTRNTTISYAEQLYMLDHDEKGASPHRYRYFLKQWPAGRVIRSLHTYDPNEVMQRQKQSILKGSGQESTQAE